MQFITNGKKYTDPKLVAQGGEGSVHAIEPDTLAKIYEKTLLHTEPRRKQKVAALCDSFHSFAHIGRTVLSAAFPQFPAYERFESLADILGFSMQWYKDAPEIDRIGFNLEAKAFNQDKGICFDDKRALAFIYNIFEAVDQLHAARIILGDVNPRNILYNPATKLPVFIDLDAAQIGNFPCLTTLDLYNDPALEHGPKTLAGGYVFDTGTDIFALAVVCFEFWIGFRPHVLRRMPVRPQKGDVENKRLGISSLKCFALGRDYLSKLGVTYIDGPENQAVERRIAQLQTQDRPLYDFFVAVFVHGERENLLLSLPVKDRRHPGYRFLADPDFMAIIDAAEQKRKASAVQARQGYIKPRATADRDFVTLIDSMSTATNRPTPRKPQPRPDPAALRYFLDHFNLGV